MTTSPIELKTLQVALEDAGEIPLWGSVPDFPWEDLSEQLGKILDQTDLTITHHRSEWQSPEDLLDGMGDDPIIQPFVLSPLPGHFHFVMPKQSQKQLIEMLLSKNQKGTGISDPTTQEGFFQFICLNASYAFNQLNPYGELTASIGSDTPLPSDSALSIDISIKIDDQQLWARVLCPKETRAAFKTYFTMENPPLTLSPEMRALKTTITFSAGNTTLKADEWKNIHVGDLVILDRCTFDNEKKRGSAQLLIGDTLLFDVRIKDGEVKILETAFTQEEIPMTDERPDDEPFEESLPEDSSDEMHEPHPSQENVAEPPSLSKDIPLTLTVEVGRIDMSLEKVAALKPGNVLDLGLSPELNVHLTVKGRRVAKGELVRIGDVMGVKILKLGD